MGAKAVASRHRVDAYTRSERERVESREGRRPEVVAALGASTGWYVGLGLGVVVILVAALIVVIIVSLAGRIAGQAAGAVDGVDKVGAQTDALAGIARINDS